MSVSAALAGTPASNRIHSTTSAFDWDTVPKAPHLQYSTCYGGSLQCARLELPMDYWNGTTNASIALPLIRRPAAVPVTHPQYGGAVLVNPGGPGGSGVDFLLRAGEQISNIIDSKDGKYFDLISFDPRGVGYSTPAISCFADPILEQSWNIRTREEGTFDSSNVALGRIWAMSQAKRGSCSVPLPGDQADIRKYATTAYVARDMLQIVEEHGRWRQQEAERLSQKQHYYRPAMQQQLPNILSYEPGKEKLQYWGFSYGTYLGSTFAAMYPDRVHRIILDGVVDAENYKQALWSNNLVDAEKAMDSLYHHCARAGYPSCALANQTGETKAMDIKRRILSMQKRLLDAPIAVLGPRPEIITYSDLRTLLFLSLYAPLKNFPLLATILSQLEAGNGTDFAQILSKYHVMSCNPSDDGNPGIRDFPDDPSTVISCSDGDDQTNVTRTAFEQFANELVDVSPTIGTVWSVLHMHCIHYSLRPVYRYTGPWQGSTAHPLLFIANTADPVTPAVNAHVMAKGFENAVTLVQDSVGHTSLAAFGNCTVRYVRRYFQTGELPAVNTTCLADEIPFGSSGENGVVNVQDRDAAGWAGHAAIADAFLKYGVGKHIRTKGDI
ncbi:hypothetical protein E4T48_01897 [Aureobasidium sp. EXF-10727]|nr:hypothetical protein E4T48_01897 [Aureobasidium sp. EXF-10727]KAI4728827.1 hypothetical protein E4T49_03392 [Aureobasidium sp. EXF-10728]